MVSLFRVASPVVWAWVGVVFAGALWGVGALAAHAALASGMTPAGLALVRFALGVPLLWLWAWRVSGAAGQRRLMSWSAQPWPVRRLVLGAGVAMALNVACWFLAIREMGAALSTVIAICCAPVFVAVLAAALGQERLGAWRGAVLAVAVSGTALVVWPAEVSALAVGGNAGWHARGVAWARTALGGWAAAYTGLVATGEAYLVFVAGTRRIGPTASVVGTLVEPLVAVGLAAWWLGEVLLWRQWLGGTLLCGAIAALALRR